MEPACFVKLHKEINESLPAFKSYIAETKSWREPDNTKQPELEVERRIAGTMLLWAIREYHFAKKIIQQKKVLKQYNWHGNLSFLSPQDKEVIHVGKKAWEWIKGKPAPGGKGHTLDKCCEILGLDPDEVRHSALLVSTWRTLKAAQGGTQ
jgi:hypothetical protein